MESRYLSFLKNVPSNFLEDLPMRNLWNVGFHHDGTPPQKVSRVTQNIQDTFQQQVNWYSYYYERPARLPDLNPFDFFLWGYFKQREYATPPSTLQEFRNRITDACASVFRTMLKKVQTRVQMSVVTEGHNLEHDR
ncbi:uncharacterized protein TNCV_365601 [Trichonephila clavipes]|nr:uncharacterized protein TNCV_365601 [Trichonephila clavipes]